VFEFLYVVMDATSRAVGRLVRSLRSGRHRVDGGERPVRRS
jgi:hypothetical protein